jgi:hypothetical protein
LHAPSPKDARVRQGAIVENKVLGDTLRANQSSMLPERGRRQSKRAGPKIAEHSRLDERFMRLRDLLA